ncbi:MAG: exodeoxyribonuclease VII large subunit [Candidatus Aenigmarchaeota archaeon]|nr:exodeoxyribonuclease VII large subunit [Candidatus Aenigmarchaeota archaeon]
MEKRIVTSLCIITIVVGLLSLFLVSEFYGPAKLEISSITKSMNNRLVLVQGIVTNLRISGENTFFVLERNNTGIKVVIFNKNYNIENNQNIIVKGRVSIYKNQLEIIANDIIVKNI